MLVTIASPAFGQGDQRYDIAISVETTVVGLGELESSVKAVGTLTAEASATLRAEVPGQIMAVHFREGQPLEKGAKLYSLEATVLEAEVNEARANANRSEAALKRAQDLHTKELISGTDYDTARANYDVDVARLRSSQAKLSKTVIRAPFDGFVGLRRINIGDYATIGQELVDVVQLDPLRVDFSIPETLLPIVQPGLPVSVTFDAYPGEKFGGSIIAVAPKSDVRGHSLEVRASLPNDELKLRPGLFVRVTVSLGVKQDTIVIPEQAIWPIGQDKTVYVVVDGKAQQRIVELGARQPGAVEIIAGLEAGEIVVTAGQMKLYEGAAVRLSGDTPTVAN
ncbi:MAG: efflux RND transporter periplasmic adaptor subunit [Gammaproteobacteria bacterium]|nr:efflux RND transporter periplasmic adaptor subunit [Gammaproteobacteria bacterium]MDH3954433.1 efflux RND transporter periplasmic adaptor subunit [Gammaproteobacteria bacterium]MDH3982719.1 efflux RND transporter periplasmic adaptor subunit [Gammaproteobacteria bacterium]